MKLIRRSDWPELYGMMKAHCVPSLPPEYEEAEPVFKQTTALCRRENGLIASAYLISPPQNGVFFLEVVGEPSRADLLEACDYAFKKLNAKVVWTQPRHRRMLAEILRAGFQASTPLDVGHPVLVLTVFARQYVKAS